MGTHTLTRVDFDSAVAELTDDGAVDDDTTDWWCVRTAPFPCPAADCDFVALFMTVAHRIMVWSDADDHFLLQVAADAKQLGRDPHIESYRRSYGPCITYDEWHAIGSPVHGKLKRPYGMPFPTF